MEFSCFPWFRTPTEARVPFQTVSGQVQLAQSLVQQLPQMAKGRHSHQTVITAMQLLPQEEIGDG